MVNTNTQEQEWIPQIGDVIYTVGSNNHQEVWDDTELIEHWDSAMEEYRRHHSKLDDEYPFATKLPTIPSAETGNSRSKPIKNRRRTHQCDSTSQQQPPPKPQSKLPLAPPPPPPPLPPHFVSTHFQSYPQQQQQQQQHLPQGLGPPGDIANVIMAWYYCGYYMGYYQGTRREE